MKELIWVHPEGCAVKIAPGGAPFFHCSLMFFVAKMIKWGINKPVAFIQATIIVRRVPRSPDVRSAICFLQLKPITFAILDYTTLILLSSTL